MYFVKHMGTESLPSVFILSKSQLLGRRGGGLRPTDPVTHTS